MKEPIEYRLGRLQNLCGHFGEKRSLSVRNPKHIAPVVKAVAHSLHRRSCHCSKVSHWRDFRLPPRSEFFGSVTQCTAVIPYRRFGIIYRSNLQGSKADQKHWQEIVALRCVTSQKSADLSHMSLRGCTNTEYVMQGDRRQQAMKRGYFMLPPRLFDVFAVLECNAS